MIGAALATFAAALGIAGQPQAVPDRVAALGAAQLAGQRIVSGFEGTSPPAAIRRRIEAGRLAGVILFDDNFGSRADARRLVAELEAVKRPAGLGPLLVMIDQEGGLVKRLPGPPSLSAQEMGAAGRRTCRRQGAATGRSLARTGINVDLAPVLDVGRPGSAIESEGRSFGRRPAAVAACGGAFAAALERNGVAATAKHFPGLGAAEANTDDAVERIGLSRRRLARFDEVPFARFARPPSPLRLVMLSSAIYPALSGRPASMSRRVVAGELRRRVGFDGVAITDALETASTAAVGGPTPAARAAAKAGTDLLLFTSLGAAANAASAVRRVAASDRAGFRASVARIVALRKALADRREAR